MCAFSKISETTGRSGIFASYGWDVQNWTKKLRIVYQTKEQRLDDQEDDGRKIFEAELIKSYL
jgi:hypothetical protein